MRLRYTPLQYAAEGTPHPKRLIYLEVKMNILALICSDNFIAVNKTLIKLFGLEPALLLGELASEAVYWNNRQETENGYFFSTVENVEERTTLSAYQQRKALNLLQDNGVIDVISKKGAPPKRYIRINEQKLLQFFNIQNSNNLTFECEEISLLNTKKLNTNNNKPKKKEKEDIYSSTIAEFPYNSEEYRQAIHDFIDMRKSLKKPLTSRALKMLINKAQELAQGDEGTIIRLFNQSTANSWLGIYPIKDNYNYRGTANSRSNNGFMDLLREVQDNDTDGNATNFGYIEDGIPEHKSRTEGNI